MNAVVKLTEYQKATELLETVLTVPPRMVAYARRVAGVPDSDPRVLAVYPLSVPQAEAIAAKADLSLDFERFDYCLEAIAEGERSQLLRTE